MKTPTVLEVKQTNNKSKISYRKFFGATWARLAFIPTRNFVRCVVICSILVASPSYNFIVLINQFINCVIYILLFLTFSYFRLLFDYCFVVFRFSWFRHFILDSKTVNDSVCSSTKLLFISCAFICCRIVERQWNFSLIACLYESLSRRLGLYFGSICVCDQGSGQRKKKTKSKINRPSSVITIIILTILC